ncbi:MAG: GEVED domain-containing protein [Flavipsychrobacter sp.]
MKTINLIITLLALLLVVKNTSAQEHINSINNCPACIKEANDDDLKWEKYAKNLQKAPRKIVNTSNGPLYEIPVVVHVLHMGETLGSVNNPTDAHIVNWIEYINQVFDCKWQAYPDENSGGVKVPIRLVLAQRDENCNSTNGITRTNGLNIWSKYINGMSDTDYAGPLPTQVNYHEVLTKLKWDRGLYYNIVIVNEIADTTKVTGLTGSPNSCFGPVIFIESDVAAAGNPEILAELGKAFSLDYTFNGDGQGATCPPNNNCLTSGDKVCDTEPHKRGFVSTGCSVTDINPCTGSSINYTDANFMSFSPRVCRNRYTQGQVNKMEYSLKNHIMWKNYLLESDAVYPPVVSNNSCKTDFSLFDTASTSVAGFSWFIFSEINDFGYYYQHQRKNLYEDHSCWQKTKVYQGRSYPIEIDLGKDLQYVKVYIDYNNDGSFHSTQELVSSSISSGRYKDTLSIPTTNVVTCKYLQMRVVTERASASSPGPCTNLERGQVRDYSVYISPESISQISIKHIGGKLPACEGDSLQFEATILNAIQGSPVYWEVNKKMDLGSLKPVVSNHVKDDKIKAVLISANHVCVTQEDSVFSNIINIPYKQQNVRPTISIDNGKIASDIYPVDWHESMSGLLVKNSFTTYSPSVTGIYYAYNVDTTGCSSIRSNNLYSFPLNVKESENDRISVYPNPASIYFEIKTLYKTINTISISNSLGQVVGYYTNVGQSLYVNTKQWQAGIYTVTILLDNGIQHVSKVMIVE